MVRSRHGSARFHLRTGGRRPFGLHSVTVGALVVLGLWAAVYQLSDTVVVSLLRIAPFDGIWPDIVFAGAGVMLILRGRREDRGWALIGIGALCWAAGDVYWQLDLATLSSPPVPSLADAGYLSFCPFAFAGILSLVRGRARAASTPLIADALAAALATGAVSAAIVVEPVLDHAHGGLLSIATNLAYPICDLALLGLLIGAMAVGGWRMNRKLLLLGASVLAFWIADSSYLVSVATGSYSQTDWYNGLWYLSPVLAAWAAWLPTAPARSVNVERGTSVRGIVMLLAFAVVSLTISTAGGFVDVGIPAIVLATAALLVILGRLVMTWQDNVRLLHASRDEAITDALTGLRNRRALISDLREVLEHARPGRAIALGLFDLDGFKQYNDSFGHPAADALLQRLGRSLAGCVGDGHAYRMGGDEFCVLIERTDRALPTAIADAARALSEGGEGFTITCSYGYVALPTEAADPESALRLADQRMYTHKRGGRASASRQLGDVLLQALAERSPDLHAHLRDVGALAAATARGFGLPPDEVDEIRQAAELHDVGKVAIPDAILHTPAPLDDAERQFIRRHTLIGERIVTAAPALARIGGIVRSSHENFDGSGYPDGLRGEQIPLGSRIISVCDAFDAMTTDRPHQGVRHEHEALAELRRCAGTQFDPAVVEQFAQALADRDRLASAA